MRPTAHPWLERGSGTATEPAKDVVPLVLIPQLIFGGALIKYEDMNKDFDMISTFQRWLTQHPEAGSAGRRDDASLRVPLISTATATRSRSISFSARKNRGPCRIRAGISKARTGN